MSDELAIQPQVQQKQSNPLLYAGLGAAAGAGAGYVGARYTTDPKYASYEDIIKEADDKFESTVKETISGEAEQTKAIDARKAAIKAGEQWENDKKAFIEANKEGAVPELASDHELMKKKAEIENSIKTIEGNTTASKTVTKEPMALLRSRLKELKKASDALQELEANGASPEEIKNARNALKTVEAKYDLAVDEIIKNTKFKNIKVINGVEVNVADSEVEKMKEALKKELKGYQADYMTAWDKYSVKKPNNKYVTTKANLAKEEQAAKEALRKLEETTGYKFEHVFNDRNNNGVKHFTNRAKIVLNSERNRNNNLKSVLKDFNYATSQTANTSFWDRAAWFFTGKELPKNDPEQALKLFLDTLTDKEKNLLKSLEESGKPITEDTIKELIKISDEKLATIKSSTATITNAHKEIKTLKEEMNKLRASLSKGQYYNEAGEICEKGKPVGKAPQFKAPELKTTAELPKEITYQTAGSGVDTKALNEAKAQLADVESKITEARNALPKTAGMSEEEAVKKFIEKNGEKSETMKKAFGEDVKALLERKIPNKKLALWLGGGAAALATLGYIFAPKNNQV